MPKVSKGVLKGKMLEYFRNVENTGEELIVTDHNKPVLKVIPFLKRQSPDELFADLRGKLKIKGDICEPAADPGDWEVLR